MAWVFNPFTGTFDFTNTGGGGGGSPGGSSGQVQYNNGGAFGGMSGTTWTDASQSLAIASTGAGTGVTTSSPVLNLTQTWNNSGVTFTGLKFNATDTASASGSLLLDLQVGGASKISIDKSGSLIIPKGSSTSASIQFAGTANSGIYCRSTSQIDFLQGGNLKFEINGNAVVVNNTSLTFNANVATNLDDCCMTRGGAGSFRFGNDLTYTNNFSLTAANTATLQLGAADVSTGAVAQTLQVQSNTGASNGPNFTIKGSNSGAGNSGGSIIFQTATAGAYATALTIASNTNATFAGLVTAPNYQMNNAGAYYTNTNSALLGQTGRSGGGPGELNFSSVGLIGWTSSSSSAYGTPDTILARDAANTLALKNSTNPQIFRAYSTTTGPSYGYFASGVTDAGVATADTLFIGTGGAGAAMTKLALVVNGTSYLSFVSPGNATFAASLYIGAANYLGWNGRSLMSSPSNGVICLSTNSGENDTFGRLQFGGTTSSFPALKRSTTTLQVRLADDSGDAAFQCGTQTAGGTAFNVNGTGGSSIASITNTSTGTLLQVLNSTSNPLMTVTDTTSGTLFSVQSTTAATLFSVNDTTSGSLLSVQNSSAATIFDVNSNGSVICNSAAVATTATDGFLYVPACAGTPTGTPTTYTGRVAIVADSTNNKLYIYSGGAWVALN